MEYRPSSPSLPESNENLHSLPASCWMRAAGAFDLPSSIPPKEPVTVVEAEAASWAPVRKDSLAVHAYDAAAGVCIAVHTTAPCASLQWVVSL